MQNGILIKTQGKFEPFLPSLAMKGSKYKYIELSKGIERIIFKCRVWLNAIILFQAHICMCVRKYNYIYTNLSYDESQNMKMEMNPHQQLINQPTITS